MAEKEEKMWSELVENIFIIDLVTFSRNVCRVVQSTKTDQLFTTQILVATRATS